MPSAFKNPAPELCKIPTTCVMCSVCKYFSVISKLPWLMSAENICNQPKQFQLQMLLRSWLTPAGGGQLSAQYLRTFTKAKAKQDMYVCSQELYSSPAMKGTYCSSFPCRWDWVCCSHYHRPDTEEDYGGCPPKERRSDHSPKQKDKMKTSISESGNKYFYPPPSGKELGICYFSHCNEPSAPKLSHAT